DHVDVERHGAVLEVARVIDDDLSGAQRGGGRGGVGGGNVEHRADGVRVDDDRLATRAAHAAAEVDTAPADVGTARVVPGGPLLGEGRIALQHRWGVRARAVGRNPDAHHALPVGAAGEVDVGRVDDR